MLLGLGLMVGGGMAMFTSISVNWGEGWGFLVVALLGYAALFGGYELIVRAAVDSEANRGDLRSLFSVVVSGLLAILLVFIWMLATRSPGNWSTAVGLMMLAVVATGAAGVVRLIRGRRR
ncbi:hypothetical protein WMF30_49085 [Sorangium sp. So ce134]